jgi:transposase
LVQQQLCLDPFSGALFIFRGCKRRSNYSNGVDNDRPFAGPAPPAAVFHYSPDRKGEHPQRHLARYGGILQADAYAGFGELYHSGRKPGPVTEAGCWAHGRRKLFDLAQLARAPLAIEAVRRIDAIFEAERTINGLLY